MSQKDLNDLLNESGLNTAFGCALHEVLQRADYQEMLNDRFSLEDASVSPHPDTLRLLLYRLLDRRNMTDSQLYHQCDIGKDHYNQVVNGKIKRYKKKGLFFQFALILQLDYFEAVYLLNLAGHPFTPWANMRDYIIAHCLCCKIYDFDEVETLLEKYGADSLYD
jgi:hypothetical protein